MALFSAFLKTSRIAFECGGTIFYLLCYGAAQVGGVFIGCSAGISLFSYLFLVFAGCLLCFRTCGALPYTH